MLFTLLILLVACSLARIPYMCREMRLETKEEEERRRIYEYCTEVCNERESSILSCSECRLPYDGYGCLWRRNEVEVNCVMDCEQLLPDKLAQLQCVENCGIGKTFNIFRSHK